MGYKRARGVNPYLSFATLKTFDAKRFQCSLGLSLMIGVSMLPFGNCLLKEGGNLLEQG